MVMGKLAYGSMRAEGREHGLEEGEVLSWYQGKERTE